MRLSSRSVLGPSVLAVSLLVLQWPGAAASRPTRTAASLPRAGSLLVKLRSGATEKSARVLFQVRGAAISKPFKRFRSSASSPIDRWWRVGLAPGADTREAFRQLAADPLVERIELDAPLSIAAVPNDPAFSQLWGLNNTGQTGGTPDADVDAPEAWEVQNASPGVVVAVIDTGVDYNHPDLAANIWTNPGEIPGNGVDDDGNGYVDDVHGYDFANRDADPMDDHGHGTHVSGTIAGVGNNGIGVAGVSWSARIMAVKFLSSGGSGWTSDAIDAVLYATDMGAKVSNNSWGGGEYSEALRDAIAAANAAGSLFVAAAGNSSSDNDVNPSYPAAYDLPNVLAVAATDHADALAGFSSYGRLTVHLGAPGVNIYSTVPATGASCCSDPSGYKSLNGTSMATPHVTGAAALLFGRFPGLTLFQAHQRLTFGGDVVSALFTRTVSSRRLNLSGIFEEDAIAPDAPVNFRVLGHSTHTVDVAWTSTADDGSAGDAASSFDLRYSTAPITPENFDAASRARIPALPSPAGVDQNVAVPGLASDTLYYFAMRFADDVGNLSGISTASDRTGREVALFQDDFEHNPDQWTFSGSDGTGLGTLWHLSAHRPHSPIGALYYGRENYWNYDTGAANYGTADTVEIDLTGRTGAWLSFWHVLQKEPLAFFDEAVVLVSDNGGLSWHPVRTFTASTPLQMQEVGIDLSAFDGRVIRIRFSFDTRDAFLNDYDGWTIDDVKVSAAVIGLPPVADAGPDRTAEPGAPVTLIGSGSYDPEGGPLTYLWTGPNGVAGTDAVVTTPAPVASANFTLQVTDVHGNSATDQMRVEVVDVIPPVVDILAPVPGETLGVGRSYEIRWSASDNGMLGGFDVHYSVDGGASYSPVPGCVGLLAAVRNCWLLPPGPPTTQGSVRVMARDIHGNIGTDAVPVVVIDPFVKVTNPDAPAVWPIWSIQTITWTHNLGPDTTVNVEVGRGGVWTPIASGVPNATATNGSYEWVVTGPSSTAARVRVTWSTTPSVNDVSDADFTIGAPAFRVRDIVAGPTGSSPRSLTNLFGVTLFAANNQVAGMEPWRSDGTMPGTTMLGDLAPGSASSDPALGATFVRIGRTTYFAATTSATGSELWRTDGTPAGTVLVKDIFPGPSSSSPGSMAEVNGILYFAATNGPNGRELWRSDGTPAGTAMVRDIRLGSPSSSPFALTAVQGVLFFTATDGFTGTELWRSEGSPGSTGLVADIFPGSSSSNPGNLLAVGGTLFFSATDSPGGAQLWRASTTFGSAFRLTFVPGGQSPQFLTSLAGIVYFAFTDGPTGTELWRSDGTPPGTFMVRDIHPTGSSSPASLTVDGNTLYFAALEPSTGRELWKSDGTLPGTVMVKDLSPGGSSSSPVGLVAGGGTVYFQATDSRGAELWESDGTAAGTGITQDINPGPAPSTPAELTVGGHRLTFVATDGPGGRELWALPRPVNIPPMARAASGGTVPADTPFTLDGSASWDGDDDPLSYEWRDQSGGVVGTGAVITLTRAVGTYAFTLTVSDGFGGVSSAAVEMIVDTYPVADAGPDQTAEVGTPVTLDGSSSYDADGDPLTFSWYRGGTSLGSGPVITVSLPTGVNTVTLNVYDDKGGWDSDSAVVTVTDTAAPTVVVTAPAEGSQLYAAVPYLVQWTASDNGTLASFDVSFSADGGASYSPVTGCVGLTGGARSCNWSMPGPPTDQGRVRVTGRDTGGNQASDDSAITVLAPALVVTGPNAGATWPIGSTQTIAWTHNFGAAAAFRVELSFNGGATWKILDGAVPASGPGTGSYDWVVAKPNSATARVRVSWTAHLPTSDVGDGDFTIGVPAYRVKNLNGAASSSPSLLTNVGGTLFFTANEVATGVELWKSDGTDAGTVLVKDITPGPVSTGITALTAVGNKVFFLTGSNSLWKSDGTAAGTTFVGSLPQPGGPSSMSQLTSFGGKLYFVGCENGLGCELWSSSGSGLSQVKDINPGTTGSSPSGLTEFNGKLYFAASDGTNGAELWASDGTPAGTALVKDINPGTPSSSPAVFRSHNGTLFFTATSQFQGRELFKTDGTAPGTVMVANSTVSYASTFIEASAGSGSLLFYRAYEENACCIFNKELWRSDGTEAGTFRTKDIVPGDSGSNPDWLTDLAGTLYFAANDSNGNQLWRSDGTSGGTVLFRTVAPTVGNSPSQLRNVKGTLFFSAGDSLGLELWETDGTAAGTGLTQDLNPGNVHASPANLTTAGHRLFFTATSNGEIELWALPRDINEPPSANAGADRTIEAGTSATITGTASDPDGDALSYEWKDEDGAVVATSVSVTVSPAVGSHTFTFTVDDGHGGVVSDELVVTVQDTTLPLVSVTAPRDVTVPTAAPLTIEWTASDVGGLAGFDVWFSGDGGASFTPVAECAGLPGAARSCVWSSGGPRSALARIRVTARDGEGNSASDEAPFVINRPPVAGAASPPPGVRNQPVVFDGTGSSDLDGDALTYAWDFGDGATGTGSNPSHAYAAMGAYSVTLTVDDGIVASAPVVVAVTVGNQVPVANAGGPYTAIRGQAVAFDGSGSADADGDALSYAWTFGDGGTSTEANPTHAFATLGSHTATLVVNDGTDSSSPATATVTITNQAPTADAGGPYSGVRGQAIAFDGSESADADGDTLTYAWDFGDGGTATGAAPTHSFTTLGSHTVTLVVNDGTDSSAPATATVTITNQVPTADAGGPYSGVRGQAIAFDGSGSSDADGDALTYAWDFGDGATSTDAAPAHAFTTLGTHTVTLVVNDGTDSSVPATATVTITNQVPTANAGGPYTAVRNQAVTFNGSGSADADGDPLTYEWSFGGGATGTGASPSHTFATLGTHTVTLVVRDGVDTSAPASTTVTVSNQPPTADAGPDQTVELGASATLNGAASSDPDQDPLSFEWRDATSAIVGTSAAVTLSLPLGTHPFTLTVRDGQGGMAGDSVSVLVRDTTPPAVSVTAPQGGALLTGVATLVQWTAADNGGLAGFDVMSSTDGGASYTVVPGCAGLDGAARSCPWTSPGPATAQGRIRVTARDASGNASAATSSFVIVNPAVSVTAPNTAVNWGIGSIQPITWTSNLGPSATVRIELSRNGGSTWTVLAASAPNTGAFNWTVSGATTSTARVRVSWTAGGVSDTSDVNFAIAAPAVTVTVPNTRVTWTIGSVRTITWNHNLGTSASMRIEVSRNGGSSWTVVASSVPNSGPSAGTHNWTVTGPSTNQARIRVSWTSNTAINDRSDANFVIP